MKQRPVYEFGPFRLAPTEGLLTRDGISVPLTPKAFETLVVLVEHNGHLVDKDELMRQVWPDTFVEEVGLARNVSSLRRALGEEPAAIRYIETVPKRGYRFVAPVKELPYEAVDLLVLRQVRARIITEEEDSSDSSRSRIGLEQSAHADSEIFATNTSAQRFLVPGAKASWWSKRNALSLLIAVAVFVFIVFLAAMIISRGRLSETGEAIDSIAVLPFVNVNNDPNTE